MERISEWVDFGKKNLSKYGFNNYQILQAKEALGLSEEAPFDKILVSAAAEELPQDLIDQLKIGGIMVIPIKDAILKIVKLSENKVDTQRFIGFAFVPLIEWFGLWKTLCWALLTVSYKYLLSHHYWKLIALKNSSS